MLAQKVKYIHKKSAYYLKYIISKNNITEKWQLYRMHGHSKVNFRTLVSCCGTVTFGFCEIFLRQSKPLLRNNNLPRNGVQSTLNAVN